jgi:hypothetical protein
MALSGYARVSTLDQDLEIQELGLRAAACDVIRAETATDTSLTELVAKGLISREGKTGKGTIYRLVERQRSLSKGSKGLKRAHTHALNSTKARYFETVV